jgi:small subunit ribosomal protein S11
MSDVQTPVTETAAAISATETKAPTGKAVKSKKKKAVRQVIHGSAFIQASYNNTIVTVTDPGGNVLGWSSAGKMGFKGPKKATPYASSVVVKDVAEKISSYGLKDIHVFVKGIGGGREGAIRGLHLNGLNVLSISDVTPIPHNGCRAPRRRRV